MKDASFGSKYIVVKLEKGNCDDEQGLANMLSSSLFLGYISLKSMTYERKIRLIADIKPLVKL